MTRPPKPPGLKFDPPAPSRNPDATPPPDPDDDECCRFHFMGGGKEKPCNEDAGRDAPICCPFHITGGAMSEPHSQTPRKTRRK